MKNCSSYGNYVELFWYNQDRQAYSSVFVSSLTVPYRRIEREFSMGGGKCVLDNDNRSRSALIALRFIYAASNGIRAVCAVTGRPFFYVYIVMIWRKLCDSGNAFYREET